MSNFVEIVKPDGERIQWNPGRKFGEDTRKERRMFERTGRYTKRPHNNRTGGRKRANKLQMRQVSAYNRLQRLRGEA